MNKVINFSEKQADFIKSDFTNVFEVNEGTPRSGKTLAGHFRYARYLLQTRDQNHLLVAYNQEQAYRLFIDGDGTGLKHIFGDLAKEKDDKHGAYLELHLPKGIRKVYYKGAGKANSVGAITGMSLGSVNFGEINLLNLQMIQECFRRTFAALDRYHLADLNPPAPHHPVIKHIFEVQDMKWLHWTPNDNPILSEKRKQSLKETLMKSDYLYKRDWLGERVMPEGVIYSMFDMDENVIPEILGKRYEMFFSADGGQSDATSCSCNIVVHHDGKFKLLRVANYYHSGKKTGQIKAMSVYAKELVKFIDYCRKKFQMNFSYLFVDPACKSLREELELLGFDTTGADNNAHDVSSRSKGIEVGIERTQNMMQDRTFLIVENNDGYDHLETFTEFGEYVRLNNGIPIDDYNHSLDELRYSVNYFYKRYIV